jgi:hypothetical protein
MNDEHIIPSEGDDTLYAGPKLRRLLAAIGRWTIGLWQWPVTFISDAVAVIWQSCRPITWRRSIRSEFMRQCYEVGAQAVPFILVSGIFVGFGIVAQSLHWLKIFGSTALFGGFLSTVLVREIAPVLVGLIVIGRSGSTLLVELGHAGCPGHRSVSLSGGAAGPGILRLYVFSDDCFCGGGLVSGICFRHAGRYDTVHFF